MYSCPADSPWGRAQGQAPRRSFRSNYVTENGHCEIVEWRGYFFSGSEREALTGPFQTLDEALDPIRHLLEFGDEIDTESATHVVYSKWPDKQTFKVIRRIVSIGDCVEVNGVKYRRTVKGYVKE